MRNLIILLLFILTCFSSCKDECLTCPDNEAVIDGECQCIGISFNGNCMSGSDFFNPYNYDGPEVGDPAEINVLYSLSTDTISHNMKNSNQFDFTGSGIKLYLLPLGWYVNRYRSYCLIETIRGSGEPYYCELTSPIGREYSDTADYYWPSAFDYNGLISQKMKAPGFEPAVHYTTEIDGQTCYLRPYVKVLDTNYVRVTFRYVTKSDEVKAECVRLFHK